MQVCFEEVGNFQIEHNYREGNNMAHILAIEGPKMKFLMVPLSWTKAITRYDSLREYITRKLYLLSCINLAIMGYLSILNYNVIATSMTLI